MLTSGNVILTVGNSMMGDDAAGPMLASLLEREPAPGWQVVEGGSAPENRLHNLRALQPARVVVVDATDMDLAPGEVRIVDTARIAESFIVTTHDMPLSFLIDSLRETVPEVIFLGIQPALVAFGFPMTPAVTQAVTAIHSHLRAGGTVDAWPVLAGPL